MIAHSRPRGEGGREAGVWGSPAFRVLSRAIEQPGRTPVAPRARAPTCRLCILTRGSRAVLARCSVLRPRVPIGSSTLIALTRQSFGGSTLVGKLCAARPARVSHPATGFSFRFLPSTCCPTEPDEGQSWHPRRNDHHSPNLLLVQVPTAHALRSSSLTCAGARRGRGDGRRVTVLVRA